MTTRQIILLELAQYLAIGAGVYLGLKGRMPWLAAIVPLVILAPFWIYRFVRRRRNVDNESPPNGQV